MKTKNKIVKKIKLIAALAVISLLLSPSAMAQTAADSPKAKTSAKPQIKPQANAQGPSAAPATEAAAESTPVDNASTAGAGAAAGAGAPPPPPPVKPEVIGGAFSSLMSESFKTDLATGAATLSIPIVVPPGRKNVQPNIALAYSSNNPNGICGVGWSLPIASIQRSTKNGVPRYGTMDNITAGGDELVMVDEAAGEYRAKIESSFTKYIYSSADDNWIAYDKSGTKYYFGSTEASRMAHPTNPSYIFAWYVDKVVDIHGNAMAYTYIKEDNYVYPEKIYYTSNDQAPVALTADKMVEFVYETAERGDKIYNRRAGWPTIIRRRLEKIEIYRDKNGDSQWTAGDLIWTYNLGYSLSASTSRSLLTSIQISAQLEGGGVQTLPAKTFKYQALEP